MVTNFIKIGDDWALVLHPAILELFKLDADTEFEVTAEDRKLFIRPIGKQISQSELDAALAEVNRKHGTTLQRLAE